MLRAIISLNSWLPSHHKDCTILCYTHTGIGGVNIIGMVPCGYHVDIIK